MTKAMQAALRDLPVAAVAEQVRAALARGHAVLTAPPGSGKTTLIPLLLSGEIILVTPRQVAARAAARRMAQLLGCRVGAEVGYHVRWDRCTGPDTRIRVMTGGMLLRQLEADPELPGTGLVILDEFHERSLESDLLLALLLEVRASLRDDLRLLVMSATLDAEPVAALLGGAPVIHAEGRQYPVEISHRSLQAAPGDLPAFARGVASRLRAVLAEGEGDVLCFLPGMREQRAVAEALGDAHGARVHILHGSLDARAQDAALMPGSGRKIILSTPIAQTSLTVEGVDAVVDSGWERQAAFDPASGVDRLLTRRISRAAAQQRAGRAGRLRPGRCLRLWSPDQHAQLAAFDTPEMLRADLASLVLRAAAWGHTDAAGLALLDAPPPRAWADARALLWALGALDSNGRITPHGRDMLAVPLHPRLAGMLLAARAAGAAQAGVWLAAAIEDGSAAGLDVEQRVRALQQRPRGDAVHRLVEDLARSIDIPPPRPKPVDEALAGRLLCAAYPDRIAQRREGAAGRFRCADGGELQLPEHAPAAHAPWLVAAHWDVGRAAGAPRRARLLAVLPEDDVLSGRCAPLEEVEHFAWDARAQAVVAERQQRLGALVLVRRPLVDPDPARVTALLCDAVADAGPDSLPWTPEARAFQARTGSLHAWCGAPWPDISDVALWRNLHDWLPPWLAGMSRLAHLSRLDMAVVLRAMLPFELLARLDRDAPPALTVPSGHRVALRYSGGEAPPVLAVKLQALFGMAEGPRVCDGRVAVQLHLLSPAGRPLQVTQDLASFWREGYAEVARQMRGRYPKHPWPEDPAAHAPTMRAKRRGVS